MGCRASVLVTVLVCGAKPWHVTVSFAVLAGATIEKTPPAVLLVSPVTPEERSWRVMGQLTTTAPDGSSTKPVKLKPGAPPAACGRADGDSNVDVRERKKTGETAYRWQDKRFTIRLEERKQLSITTSIGLRPYV